MSDASGARSSILLVEDFDDARELYAMCLRAAGYAVTEASTGEDAIRFAKDYGPDLILMDMALPGIDGWEATALLKRDPQTRGIPVIALTAHALSDERERMAHVGCDGFLAKPCLPPDLLAVVKCLLGSPRTSQVRND